jgi:STE24 endopeptidase
VSWVFERPAWLRIARRAPSLVLTLVLAVTAALRAGAAPPAADAPAPTLAAAASTTSPANAIQTTPDAAPVLVPEPTQKAMRYYRSGNILWCVATAWGLVVPAFLLGTGFSARMRTWAQRLGRKWFFVIVIYFLLFSAVLYLLNWPLAFYAGYLRQHAYGLSNQTFARWIGDSLKELFVGVISGTALLWLPYLILRKFPRWWWLMASFGALPLIACFLFIAPVWIDPLFNQFGPMKNKALEQDILRLADRAGIGGSRVFEVNKSIDTQTVNAYVTGFRQTKRIVLWDTIIAKLDKPELLFVMGHEMGHYVLGHVWQLIIGAWLLVSVTLYAIHRAAAGVLHRFKDAFGFDQLADVASLPLVLLFFQLSTLLLTPPIFAFTRHNEHEADRFGLEMTRDNRAAATAFVKLQQENLSNPRPGWLFKLWRETHPPLGERIDFCNSYHPWRQGQPLRYERLLRDKPPPAPTR